MVESAIEDLRNNIAGFILAETNLEKYGNLIQKHTEHLSKNGDLSIPNDIRVWQCVKKSSKCDTSQLCENITEKIPDMIIKSKSWTLPVDYFKEIESNVHLFLDRPPAIKSGILEGVKNNSFLHKQLDNNMVYIQSDSLSESPGSVTSLRLERLCKCINNLCAVRAIPKQQEPKIFVTSKSSNQCEGSHKILCGAVLNVKTNTKESTISAEEFIQQRQNEMSLIAEHRYGVRSSVVSTPMKWKDFIRHIGKSAAIFELLQTRPSSSVKINFECASMGSSKGVAFILYNLARLETLLRTFSEKVETGTYPHLPEIESVDFSLLCQEEEWILVYNYILGLPLLLKQCVHLTNKNCEFRPHHICSFLSCMVRIFSQYYRRVRILTEPRTHLLPVLFARIHFLKVLTSTLKTCLRILSIDPPEVTANFRM